MNRSDLLLRACPYVWALEASGNFGWKADIRRTGLPACAKDRFGTRDAFIAKPPGLQRTAR